MKKAGIILLTLTSMVLAGCSKYSSECEIVVRPYAMPTSGSDPQSPANMVRLYAWYISEADAYDSNWAPESYADADAGLVSHRTTGEVRAHGLMSEQSGEAPYDVRMTVSLSPVLLVAVDPVNRFYAYRVFRYKVPFPQVTVPVTFKVWQRNEPYRENEWMIVGEPEPDENSQEEEGGEGI